MPESATPSSSAGVGAGFWCVSAKFWIRASVAANIRMFSVCCESTEGVDGGYEVLVLKVRVALGNGERGMAGDPLDERRGDAFVLDQVIHRSLDSG